MNEPQVSIVLPTWNRLGYLRCAVESVLAQTFADWELIIADDGSGAETRDWLATLNTALPPTSNTAREAAPASGCGSTPRVRVLHLQHSGKPAVARNAAIRVARGEFIAFLDSDDVWLPRKLELQVAALTSRRDCAWSQTAFAVMGEDGQLLTGTQARSWPALQGWILDGLIRMESVIAIPSVLVRRSVLESLGGFDESIRMCEDYDLWLRLAQLSALLGVPEILLHVRSHREHFHRESGVYEGRLRAIEKMLTAGSEGTRLELLQRERARVAAGLARSQAIQLSRGAALRTLLRSSAYSWSYGNWWVQGAKAAARALTPRSVQRMAGRVVRRGRA